MPHCLQSLSFYCCKVQGFEFLLWSTVCNINLVKQERQQWVFFLIYTIPRKGEEIWSFVCSCRFREVHSHCLILCGGTCLPKPTNSGESQNHRGLGWMGQVQVASSSLLFEAGDLLTLETRSAMALYLETWQALWTTALFCHWGNFS